MIIEGKVHILGDNVDTDVMVPGRYLALTDPQEIAKHLFEEVDPDFVRRVRKGDVLVAGKNFGAGSGREHAPLALKAVGIGCIVATSFARTFFRMAVDLALPTITCPAAVSVARQGDHIILDTRTGDVRIGGYTFNTAPLPAFIQEIIEAGGIANWVKSKLQQQSA